MENYLRGLIVFYCAVSLTVSYPWEEFSFKCWVGECNLAQKCDQKLTTDCDLRIHTCVTNIYREAKLKKGRCGDLEIPCLAGNWGIMEEYCCFTSECNKPSLTYTSATQFNSAPKFYVILLNFITCSLNYWETKCSL